jgi:hypothetical protein
MDRREYGTGLLDLVKYIYFPNGLLSLRPPKLLYLSSTRGRTETGGYFEEVD